MIVKQTESFGREFNDSVVLLLFLILTITQFRLFKQTYQLEKTSLLEDGSAYGTCSQKNADHKKNWRTNDHRHFLAGARLEGDFRAFNCCWPTQQNGQKQTVSEISKILSWYTEAASVSYCSFLPGNCECFGSKWWRTSLFTQFLLTSNPSRFSCWDQY